jgi:tRNA(fMet)-specific endonuclease VapC
LIDYLEGVQPIRDWIAALISGGSIAITAVTAFEILSGARDGRRGDQARRLVARLPVLSLDREAAESAAQVRQQLERAGRGIGMGDSLIAGIALTHDLPLLTRNVKHFSRVDGLRLPELPRPAG